MERREKGGILGITHTQGFTETWYVQIVRKNCKEPENLFRFIGDGGGDGTAVMPHDIVGIQYEKALRYAELVSNYTESQLGKEINILKNFKQLDHYKCLKCGHEGTSKDECIYCGGKEIENVS